MACRLGVSTDLASEAPLGTAARCDEPRPVLAPSVLARADNRDPRRHRCIRAGFGQPITAGPEMVRTPDGKTIVSVHVVGPERQHHVRSPRHQLPCGTSEADGHYRTTRPATRSAQQRLAWLSTPRAGVGNGKATVAWTAGATAVSVVVHAPGGAKIACADLS